MNEEDLKKGDVLISEEYPAVNLGIFDHIQDDKFYFYKHNRLDWSWKKNLKDVTVKDKKIVLTKANIEGDEVLKKFVASLEAKTDKNYKAEAMKTADGFAIYITDITPKTLSDKIILSKSSCGTIEKIKVICVEDVKQSIKKIFDKIDVKLEDPRMVHASKASFLISRAIIIEEIGKELI